jgi:hypothetical protein
VKHDDVFDGNSDLSRHVPFFLLLQLFSQLSFFKHYLFKATSLHIPWRDLISRPIVPVSRWLYVCSFLLLCTTLFPIIFFRTLPFLKLPPYIYPGEIWSHDP